MLAKGPSFIRLVFENWAQLEISGVRLCKFYRIFKKQILQYFQKISTGLSTNSIGFSTNSTGFAANNTGFFQLFIQDFQQILQMMQNSTNLGAPSMRYSVYTTTQYGLVNSPTPELL